MSEILRRKLRHAQQAETPPHALVDQAWRLALARALREGPGLASETTAMTSRQCGLADLPELPPERALIALLDGPGGAMGIAALSPDLTGALIEMQTIGRVGAAASGTRRPTRTDAAMISPMLDRALARFDFLIRDLPEARVEEGFRFASLLEDARSIGLLLDDLPYHLMTARLSLAAGAREGEFLLALPLAPPAPEGQVKAAGPGPEPGSDPREGVGQARCELRAVLGQRSLTLHEVMQLEPGQMLTLNDAAITRISLRGIDGKTVAMARLGQQNGHRALRINSFAGAAVAAGEGVEMPVEDMVAETFAAARTEAAIGAEGGALPDSTGEEQQHYRASA